MGRADRLKEVYEYVRTKFPIHTQSDFAEWLKYNRTYISSAMHGNAKNLTDKLFVNICEVFPGVFDLNYLLTGEGSLLTIEEEVHNEEYEKLDNLQTVDQSSLVNAALAAKDETIETLKGRIVDLQRTIADKVDIIKARETRIVDLERQLAVATMSDVTSYPFKVGVAEERENTQM